MTDRLVAYVTDAGYLLPSIVSACQLADSGAARGIDIAIFTVAVPDETLSALQAALSAYKLSFIPMDSAAYMPQSLDHFRGGHVQPAALGRLVLSDYVPAQYEHIVYIDGDTQICGDVSALLNYDTPEGQIAAVSESFFLDRPTPHRTKYLAALEVENAVDYFNSGVLAFRKSSWARIGPQALDYFLRNQERCEFHDQSALNAVCLGRRVALAPAYNFHTGFAELDPGGVSGRRIVHFTGSEKPWNYQVWPWSGRFAGPYRAFLDANPSLTFKLKVAFSPGWKQFVRGLQKRRKYRAQYADLAERRRRFLDYVRGTAFPF